MPCSIEATDVIELSLGHSALEDVSTAREIPLIPFDCGPLRFEWNSTLPTTDAQRKISFVCGNIARRTQLHT
jgi:hypothetical protein